MRILTSGSSLSTLELGCPSGELQNEMKRKEQGRQVQCHTHAAALEGLALALVAVFEVGSFFAVDEADLDVAAVSSAVAVAFLAELRVDRVDAEGAAASVSSARFLWR